MNGWVLVALVVGGFAAIDLLEPSADTGLLLSALATVGVCLAAFVAALTR